MAYRVHVDHEHMQWLMEQFEARCKDKETANLLRIHGRFDLEIAITVAPPDRHEITDEFLVDMKRAMRERTGLLSPVIPRKVREWDPYY